MLGALAIALRATARALPLQSDIDALELEVELRFRNVPGILNSEQSSQQFGVAHALPIPKDRHFPSPHPLQVPMRLESFVIAELGTSIHQVPDVTKVRFYSDIGQYT